MGVRTTRTPCGEPAGGPGCVSGAEQGPAGWPCPLSLASPVSSSSLGCSGPLSFKTVPLLQHTITSLILI